MPVEHAIDARAELVRPRPLGLDHDVRADDAARLARERRARTFCTTLRSTMIAATPSATQRKKNSSRAQDGARLAPRHAEDEAHHDAPRGRRGVRAALDDAAVAQRDDLVGQRRELGVVRDEHERPAAVAVDRHEQLDDLAAGGAVEIARRLVGQQDRRIVGERARDRDALLLAARQLRRIVMPAVRQPDVGEQRRARAPAHPSRRRSPSAPGCSRAPSATAAGGRTERRSRSSRRAAAPAPPRSSAVMSTPSSRMRPVVGASSPAMRPSSVDLPLPDGPVIATDWPRAMRKDVG